MNPEKQKKSKVKHEEVFDYDEYQNEIVDLERE
jgi:hypothetical protein